MNASADVLLPGKRVEVALSLEYPEDCERMRRVLADRGCAITPGACAALWSDHSEGVSATWLVLPPDDERLYRALLEGIASSNGVIEWTPERPDAPGFYWWMPQGSERIIADLRHDPDDQPPWYWYTGCGDDYDDNSSPDGSLWWPVRLDPPPVG